MKKLLIATTNKAKKEELMEFLHNFAKKGIQLLSLDDLQITADPEETGETFKDNAELKAKYYGDLTGLPTLSDDGGLCIDVLNGEPGVHSRRWKGYKMTDQEIIDYTIEKLQGVAANKRTGEFKVCLTFYNPADKTLISVEDSTAVRIAEKPIELISNGFPFRTLMIVQKYNKFYHELTEEEHAAINHRVRALNKLTQQLIKHYSL